ncbi:hypothetical protein M231_05104 [Tremella mesenterica]|uniref:Mitochondrial import inner membrane translocase subunit TIM50 n=1 Tax=Tremella mesenterica TaxID=5217 RepID=A0A4Q1BIY5_TREME|nr:hypothetical protein M231_05104 [Tremella mesenterica]
MNTLSRLDSSISRVIFPPTSSSSSSTFNPLPPPSRSIRRRPSLAPSALRQRHVSNLPPEGRSKALHDKSRPKTTTANIKVPPPSTPLLLRLVLVLWAILLSFWQSIVGQTRATRVKRRRRRRTIGESSDDGTETTEGEGSKGKIHAKKKKHSSHITDSTSTTTDNNNTSSRLRESSSLTFRLRPTPPSSKPSQPKPLSPTPAPTSILSNPLQTTKPSPRIPEKRVSGLLPSPITTSVLDPSVPPTTVTSLSRQKPNQVPFFRKKALILVLDLDETLIHSTSRPLGYATASTGGGGILGLSFGGWFGRGGKGREGHTIEVILNGRSTTYHVYKRPYVDHFLKKVSAWYTLVIFTASMPEYADPVIDWLDGGRNLFAKKLYRDSCHMQRNGTYIKDLTMVEPDLARVCILDNSPVSYTWHKGGLTF